MSHFEYGGTDERRHFVEVDVAAELKFLLHLASLAQTCRLAEYAIGRWTSSVQMRQQRLHHSQQPLAVFVVRELVSWSLTSLFSTNMAISETNGHSL